MRVDPVRSRNAHQKTQTDGRNAQRAVRSHSHIGLSEPNTTVVVMNLYVVCSANIWRSLGASGAIRTRPGYAPRAAVWRARDPRRGAESRRHSAVHQPARGLEGCQTA